MRMIKIPLLVLLVITFANSALCNEKESKIGTIQVLNERIGSTSSNNNNSNNVNSKRDIAEQPDQRVQIPFITSQNHYSQSHQPIGQYVSSASVAQVGYAKSPQNEADFRTAYWGNANHVPYNSGDHQMSSVSGSTNSGVGKFAPSNYGHLQMSYAPPVPVQYALTVGASPSHGGLLQTAHPVQAHAFQIALPPQYSAHNNGGHYMPTAPQIALLASAPSAKYYTSQQTAVLSPPQQHEYYYTQPYAFSIQPSIHIQSQPNKPMSMPTLTAQQYRHVPASSSYASHTQQLPVTSQVAVTPAKVNSVLPQSISYATVAPITYAHHEKASYSSVVPGRNTENNAAQYGIHVSPQSGLSAKFLPSSGYLPKYSYLH